MYRIAICDADASFLKYMKEMILRCDIRLEEVEFYDYTSGEDFAGHLNLLPSCELLIVDMQLKGMDGHETARHFRKYFPHSVLVFCSGDAAPTEESFKVAPYRYLSKKYSDERMVSELGVVICRMKESSRAPVIIGKEHINIIRLRPDDILFIENWKYGSIIHVRREGMEYFSGETVSTERKIADLYPELKGHGFGYAHNSYIVNMNYVVQMKSQGIITLSNGQELNVSRSKLKIFRKELSELIERKG
ncbi:MAG: LytTR family transcriptional regulator DNA-binding domain-containing protein [Lachnospiraceae bacterium]|nr:LytTR family transcriptional regulator DNA-binding domain-containing protein [Lachnospiraceae bacterium]